MECRCKELGPASYKLTAQTSYGRGVYSFCMCPGGYVVNASSEEKRLAVNGMSYHDRAGENANSALIVTVNPEDFLTILKAGKRYILWQVFISRESLRKRHMRQEMEKYRFSCMEILKTEKSQKNLAKFTRLSAENINLQT